MKLLVTTAHPSLAEHRDPETGELHRSPRHASSIERTAAAGIPWAADNDCFQGLDHRRYCTLLDRLHGLPAACSSPSPTSSAACAASALSTATRTAAPAAARPPSTRLAA